MIRVNRTHFNRPSEIKKNFGADRVWSISAASSGILGWDPFGLPEAPRKAQDTVRDRSMPGRPPAHWSERDEVCDGIRHDPVVADTRRMEAVLRSLAAMLALRESVHWLGPPLATGRETSGILSRSRRAAGSGLCALPK